MFSKSRHHYVPVLFWKRAEQAALRSLAAGTKAAMTPLLQITPIPIDQKTGAPRTTLPKYGAECVNQLVDSWGVDDDFFLDCERIAGASLHGKTGADLVFDGASAASLPFVPTIGPQSQPATIAAALRNRQRGVALRLSTQSLGSPSAGAGVLQFAKAHGLSPSTTDIVVDLGALSNQDQFVVFAVAVAVLARVPNIASWRTLTIVASSFPASTSAVASSTVAMIDRAEWLAWQTLRAPPVAVSRLPTFGDFGIQHPAGVEGFDPQTMQVSANIRYTTGNQWMIMKGVGSKKTPLATQYPKLARALTQSTHFAGSGHCDGCDDILSCAGGAGGFGSPTPWRRIGTAHHIETAATQLGQLPFP